LLELLDRLNQTIAALSVTIEQEARSVTRHSGGGRIPGSVFLTALVLF